MYYENLYIFTFSLIFLTQKKKKSNKQINQYIQMHNLQEYIYNRVVAGPST